MDKLINEPLYEDSEGRQYRLRGCTNAPCYCTGKCREKIYLDGKPEFSPELLQESIKKFWSKASTTVK